MSKIEVNAVEPQCGTTLTVGASGDTVSLPSGTTLSSAGTVNFSSATQTGVGRQGTVDWDTTAKTASFTAVSGTGYFVNTTSGAVTMTLPATPSAGDIVSVKDYAGTAGTNEITVARNGSNIRGATDNFKLEKSNSGAVFIYVDGTEGWQVFVDGSDSDAQRSYISASGGTETICGDYKIHTFTGPGTFTVNSLSCSPASNVDYLVVAGGAGGGNGKAGGGGAGGFRESGGTASGCYTTSPLGSCVSSLPVSITSYPITVGAGGAGTPAPATPGCAPQSSPGNNSVFSTITSAGGGGAGSVAPSTKNGLPGGSGGGASQYAGAGTGGTGNTPPVSPPQGNNGGNGFEPGAGGGGGGATSVGTNATPIGPQAIAGDGGNGAGTAINPSPSVGTPGPSAPLRYFSGGGGGGMASCSPEPEPTGLGTGGYGGGGCGQNTDLPRPSCATGGANTGGGGGGSSGPSTGPHTIAGGAGGSGIVIIRYKYQ